MSIYVDGRDGSLRRSALSMPAAFLSICAILALPVSVPSTFATSPTANAEADENAAIGAFLKDRSISEKEAPFCFNTTLNGITAEQLTDIKAKASDPGPNPEGRRFTADLKRLSYKPLYQEKRVVQFTPEEENLLKIRPATIDECRSHVTYRLNRVIFGKKYAIIVGVNPRFGETIMFTMNLSKSSGAWSAGYFHKYDFFSGPPSSSQFRRVLPGMAGDKFYIAGEGK